MTDLGLPPLQGRLATRQAVPTRSLAHVARGAWHVAARLGTSSVFIGALLAVASWPGGATALSPYAGLDGSWQAALAMASHQRLPFGTQIIFTYGPLGFLTSGELYYSGTAMLGFVFKLALATAIFAVFVGVLRKHLPLVVAAVVAYVVGYPIAAMWFGPEAVLVLMLVMCVSLLSRTESVSATRWSWIGLGAVSGLMVLEKLSLGVGIVVLAAIAVACAPIRRRHVAAALTFGPFAVVFLSGWFGTGNSFANLIAYVRGAQEAAAGYSAISLDPPNQPHNLVFAVLIGIAIVATAALYARNLLVSASGTEIDEHGSKFTRWTAFGVVAATSLVTWMLFKEGFVRQDGHRLVYFASVPLILSAFMVTRPSGAYRHANPDRLSWGSGAMLVAVLLGSALAALAVAGEVPTNLIDPGSSFSGFGSTVQTMVSANRRHDVVVEARRTMRVIYGIPPAMIARLNGQTVDIDPVEQSVAWAYPQFRWDPLPTIQAYFAYTPTLDRVDVRDIASKRAPRFILRQVQSSVDGGLPIFGEPATEIAIDCSYRRIDDSPGWLLLEHSANRCGRMQETGRAHAAFGQPIPVPKAPPGDMIVAAFDLHLPAWWHLLDTVYKPPPIWVGIDGGTLSRFVEATASDLHVLQSASTQGFPARFGPPPAHSLIVTSHGAGGSKHHIDVTFYEIPVT